MPHLLQLIPLSPTKVWGHKYWGISYQYLAADNCGQKFQRMLISVAKVQGLWLWGCSCLEWPKVVLCCVPLLSRLNVVESTGSSFVFVLPTTVTNVMSLLF